MTRNLLHYVMCERSKLPDKRKESIHFTKINTDVNRTAMNGMQSTF